MSAADALVRRLAELLGTTVAGIRPVGGGCVTPSYRVDLADDRVVFAKADPSARPGFFAAEAAGLVWLAQAEPGLVPGVVAAADDVLVLEWLASGVPTDGAAEDLGRALARLHASGAPGFGARWPGAIGPLAMDNTPAQDWAEFFVRRRLAPYLRLAVDRRAIGERDRRAVEDVMGRIGQLAGPVEPPARLHGDLWLGNIVWGFGQAWLVDPAAYGGHRESDLAMLALFGAPELDRILAAYREVSPLADGWRDRVRLHQLFPLLVHAVLFGSGYGEAAGEAARSVLAAS